jgi:hypothetical protein
MPDHPPAGVLLRATACRRKPFLGEVPEETPEGEARQTRRPPPVTQRW